MTEEAELTVRFMVSEELDFYNFERLYSFKFGRRPTSIEKSWAEDRLYDETSSYDSYDETSYDSYDDE